MNEKGLYLIGEIAKICRVPGSTLRYYDEMGIIKPSYIDESSCYRYYDNEALMLVPVIKYYQKLGFKLREISQLLAREDLFYLKDLFKKQIEAQKKEINQLQMELDSIVSWYDLISETEAVIAGNAFDVSLKQFGKTKMFWVDITPFNGMRFENLLINNEICNYIGNPELITLGALYAHFPTEETRFSHDFKGISLYIKNHPNNDDCGLVEEFGGFNAVACYHRGRHKEVAKTYEKMKAWAKEHNLTLRGDIIERYVIDYWSIKNSDWFLTEIFFPLL